MTYEHLMDFQTVEPGATIVSMLTYKDMVLIATQRSIYVIKDGKIELMQFEMQRIADATQSR